MKKRISKKFKNVSINTILILFTRYRLLLKPYLWMINLFLKDKIKLSKLVSTSELKQSMLFQKAYDNDLYRAEFSRVNQALEDVDITSPVIGVYTLKDTVINPSTHLFYYSSRFYYFDIPNVGCASFGHAGRPIIENTSEEILYYDSPVQNLEKGIFIGGQYHSNWFHWCWEIVSRISVLKKVQIDLSKYPVLVPNDILDIPNLHTFLEYLLDGLEVHYILPRSNYKVKSLVLADAPMCAMPALKPELACRNVSFAQINRDALGDYRNLIKSSIKANKKEFPRKIFLGRKHKNRTYNQEEVFNFFQKLGFEMVYCEDLDVSEQYTLFSQAVAIVGPTGASWSNLLFCNSNCKALCWMPNFDNKIPLYAAIGNSLGIDIRYAFFDTHHSDWLSFKKFGTYELSEEFLKKESAFMLIS